MPNKIYDRSKTTENVYYSKYFGSMTINVARCTHEIISRIAMTKAAYTKRRIFSPGNWT